MSPQGKNLLLRVASAVVLLPIVLALVWAGGWFFAVLVAVVSALCAFEMTVIALRDSPLPARLIVVAYAAGAPLALVSSDMAPSGEAVLMAVMVLVIALWVVHLLALGDDLRAVPGQVGLSLLAVGYTGGLLAPMVLLREEEAGVWWIVLVLAITFLNDTGAYFAGRSLGRHKLYPRVSPAKTWEGFVGGLAGGLAGSVGVVLVSQSFGAAPLPMGLHFAAVLGLIVAAVASAGDLAESLLKRAFSVKDSGQVIPGHGGMLDRVDALLFTGPVVWFFAVLS